MPARKVVRSTKTGRFAKTQAADYAPSKVKVESLRQRRRRRVKMFKSLATGRFVKASTARRHPEQVVEVEVLR